MGGAGSPQFGSWPAIGRRTAEDRPSAPGLWSVIGVPSRRSSPVADRSLAPGQASGQQAVRPGTGRGLMAPVGVRADH